MNALKLLLVVCLLSIIPSQLVRIPIAAATITISDIAVFTTAIISAFYFLSVKRSLLFQPRIVIPAFIFSLVATASTILAVNNFPTKEVLTGALFLVRFIAYFLISTTAANVIQKDKINSWLNLFLFVSVLYTIIGFAQFVIFPDLTFLAQFGWDPHQRRLVSTFLDPNFSGGFLTIAFAIAAALFLDKTRKIYLLTAAIIFLGIVLTFSRSSYIALLVVLTTIGLLKSPKLFLGFLTLFITSAFFVPQIKARIIGAAEIDDTAQARIQSWSNAITIFSKNPTLGVGFNTYRYAQEKYGFFTDDNPQGGHSGAGSDSSILLVLATTGVLGIAVYTFFLLEIGHTFAKGAQTNAFHLGSLAAFLGLLVHSQFVNSLFFPQIMLVLWFLLGLASAHDS